MIHTGRLYPSPGLAEIIERNVRFNLVAMYREQGEIGWIEERGKVKLGAIAIAALALREFHEKDAFRDQYIRLCNTVRSMWMESGRFRTFLAPADRDDCHNFYPGEALLLWANILHDEMDPRLLECFSRSFYFYGDWHRSNRNPAFVPWHTMAYARLWDRMPDPRLVEAIFDMNDWLLGIQQWDDAPSPECRGRFYAPDRPFGPPHASSTAVYLEGLVEAFRIARATGDTDREKSYRRSILRGLRSLAQLTYKCDADMIGFANPERTLGGVRSNETDDTIRVDNVQHSIMAIQGVLSSFQPSDWNWID